MVWKNIERIMRFFIILCMDFSMESAKHEFFEKSHSFFGKFEVYCQIRFIFEFICLYLYLLQIFSFLFPFLHYESVQEKFYANP